MPVAISAGGFQTRRLKLVDEDNGNIGLGFRVLLSPTLRVNQNWFFYSDLQVTRSPYLYYYDSYYDQSTYQAKLLQGFVGYTHSASRGSLILKAGRMASAFGSFPVRYDDFQIPLLDPPMSYGSYTKLRSDQLPCGVQDFRAQRNRDVEIEFGCGGSTSDSAGLQPVTVFGLPGVEAEVSLARLDARLQLTNSSPANPHSLISASQHVQWTAGAGYRLHPGLRIGASAFRGPYLDRIVEPLLPSRTNVRDFPATAVGFDAQWTWRRLSGNAEWQRFQFDYPGLTRSPVLTFAYAEMKVILSPRLYAAARVSYELHNRIADDREVLEAGFSPNRSAYEAAIGFRPNRRQLIKAGYEWRHLEGYPGSLQNVLGVQFVTSIDAISKAFHAGSE